MKKLNSKRKLALVLVLCVVALFGVTAYAITTVQVAKGTIAHYEPFNGPADVAIRKNTFQPGDVGPWHYHPGDTYVIVTAGTLTEMTGCGEVRMYSAGDAFYERSDGNVHQISNRGTVPAEAYTLGIVPAGQPPSIVFAGPHCGPPTSTKQCKDGGWMSFNFPRTFKNQGDCIRFVKGDRDDDGDDDDHHN